MLFVKLRAGSRFDSIVILVDSFEGLSFSLSYLLAASEWFYIPVESLSHTRRAILCILVLLEQNQVVDFVVVEHRPDST